MDGCKHIFTKGVNVGKICNQKIFHYSYCRKHFKPFYGKWRLDRDTNPFDGRRITMAMRKALEKLDVPLPARNIKEISQQECEEFLSNMEINPLTKRKIKKDGPVYKTLISKCSPSPRRRRSPAKKIADISKEECNEFLANMKVNPLTKRKIKNRKAVYNELVNTCFPNRRLNAPNLSSLDRLRLICEEWFSNKFVHPITKRKILPKNKAFKELAKSCANVPFKQGSLVQVTDLPFPVPRIKENIFTNTLTDIKVPQKIKNWILGKKLGEGGFGIVYECYDRNHPNEPPKSIKIEHVNATTVNMEANFYKKIKVLKSKYFPIVYDIGNTDKFRYIVIEKLEKLVFTFERIPYIIRGLKLFADMKVSHGDFKFENLMQRINTKDAVFVDFGLTFSIDTKITKVNKGLAYGTLLFMSINAHNGIISYSNDLESLVYCVLDMIHKLPWYDMAEFENINDVLNTKEIFKDKILSKDRKTMKDFNLDKYPRLYAFVKTVLTTKLHEKPDYDYLENLFK